MPDTKFRPTGTMKSKDKSNKQRFGHVNATNRNSYLNYHFYWIKKKKKKKKKKFIVHRKTNNTNSDVTTSTKVLCRAARIAETMTAGRPT